MSSCAMCGWDMGSQTTCSRCGREAAAAAPSVLQDAPPPVPGTGSSSAATSYSAPKTSRAASIVGGFAIGCSVAAIVAGIIILWVLVQFAISTPTSLGEHVLALGAGSGVANVALAGLSMSFRKLSLGGGQAS
jgi:hypothetical protein